MLTYLREGQEANRVYAFRPLEMHAPECSQHDQQERHAFELDTGNHSKSKAVLIPNINVPVDMISLLKQVSSIQLCCPYLPMRVFAPIVSLSPFSRLMVSSSLALILSQSNTSTRSACVLGSCTMSHLRSFHTGVSVFFLCSYMSAA